MSGYLFVYSLKKTNIMSLDQVITGNHYNHWIENVSLMIIRPITNSSSTISSLYDYEIFLEKANNNNHFVQKFSYEKFPRENVSIEDFSRSWIEQLSDSSLWFKHRYSKKFRNVPMIENNQFSSLLADHPELFHNDMAFALRIAAIRCLFRKTGILLAHNVNIIDNKLEWWKKIQTNGPKFFREMFTKTPELKLNFKQLFEWRNWLTPTTVGKSARYDTMFYVLILKDDVYQHFSINGYWTKLDLFNHNFNTILPPNDFYELKYLSKFYRLTELEFYFKSEKYQNISIERWLPSVQIFKNGSITFLPGNLDLLNSVNNVNNICKIAHR